MLDQESMEVLKEAERELKLSPEVIHQAVVDTATDVLRLISQRAKDLMGNARGSSWLFRGRVIQVLFRNHFGWVLAESDEQLRRAEDEERQKSTEV